MYDVDSNDDGELNIDSRITITIPSDLGQVGEDDDFTDAAAPQKGISGGDEYVTVSRTSGTVVFKNPNDKITIDEINSK